MAMNIEDPEAERLAAQHGRRGRTLTRVLEDEIWPRVPVEDQGRPPMTKAEREELLGYGPEGV